MPPCLSSSSAASSLVVTHRNGFASKSEKNQLNHNETEGDMCVSDVCSEDLRVLDKDTDTTECSLVEESGYDDDEYGNERNGNCNPNSCGDGGALNDDGSSCSGHDKDCGGDVGMDEMQRPSSPFVVLGYVEHNGCLADQGMVELSRVALEEERACLAKELATLRSAENLRRRRLFETLTGQCKQGANSDDGMCPTNRGILCSGVEYKTAATRWQSERPVASGGTASTTLSVTSSQRFPQSCKSNEKRPRNGYQSSQCSRNGSTSDAGGFEGEPEKKREDANWSEHGDGVLHSSITGVKGAVRKGSGEIERRSSRTEAEGGEDDPLFLCRLMHLDDISPEGLMELAREHHRITSGIDEEEEKDSVQPGADTSGLSGGYVCPMPTGAVGTLEYVFDDDDAAKRKVFHKRESELMLAHQRVIAKMEALMCNRLTTGTHYWQSNESVDSCPRCGKMFSILVRKHHCRRCGSLLCNDCCSQVGRDMYASSPVGRGKTDGKDAKPHSDTTFGSGNTRTTPSRRNNEWMFDTYDLTDATNVTSGEVKSAISSLNSGTSVDVRNVKDTNSMARKHKKKHGFGRGGLKVRTAPWCRICNCCYLVCLRARVAKNYNDVLEDGRRRFHVLKEEEQSIMNFNMTWETRCAQLDVLRHLIMEKTASVAHVQMQHVAGVVSGWMRNLGQRAEDDGSE